MAFECSVLPVGKSAAILGAGPLGMLSLSGCLNSGCLSAMSGVSVMPVLFGIRPRVANVVSPLYVPVIDPFYVSYTSGSSPLGCLSDVSSSISTVDSVETSFALVTSSLGSPSGSSVFSGVLYDFAGFLSLCVNVVVNAVLFPCYSLGVSGMSLCLSFSLSVLFVGVVLKASSIGSGSFSIPA